MFPPGADMMNPGESELNAVQFKRCSQSRCATPRWPHVCRPTAAVSASSLCFAFEPLSFPLVCIPAANPNEERGGDFTTSVRPAVQPHQSKLCHLILSGRTHARTAAEPPTLIKIHS